MDLTRDDLISYLREEQNIDEPIEGATELFSSGLLDSVSMVGLITFIEERTGSVISPSDVTLENFDTVDRILDHVAGLD
ncbi:MAG TPA: phosphopantetheine-binding protein [Paracoccus sp. (in: a-proteobacteria)]|uniref:acyl carrier protein n=1 Tax=Paracoccus sp. TaxID=267 RepID=UPI002BED5F97|nr:phosphopantetheine-binding protein [Paracoccus sp. (in: a-proteobacteria)]HWL59173.1 phosphopantetheine-binding protein [Paracoccus sp. (in: a-proteobacteria)]